MTGSWGSTIAQTGEADLSEEMLTTFAWLPLCEDNSTPPSLQHLALLPRPLLRIFAASCRECPVSSLRWRRRARIASTMITRAVKAGRTAATALKAMLLKVITSITATRDATREITVPAITVTTA